MSSILTMWLGVALASIALVSIFVAIKLHRVPVQADATGQAASSAPPSLLGFQRALDLVALVVYAALLTEMVPRIWQYTVDRDWQMLAHAGFALLLGLVLILKLVGSFGIGRFESRASLFSTLALILVLLTAAFVLPTALQLQQPFAAAPAGTEESFNRGRLVLSTKCGQCHGLRTVASERRTLEEWKITVGLMQGRSTTFPGKEPISDDERDAVAQYLHVVLGK